MATNLDLITVALRDLTVIGETEPVSAEQGQHALTTLNDLMEAWTENDIDLGYFAQSSTTDTSPIPPWARMGVQAALAIALAPTYGATISQELALKAQSGYQIISRKAIYQKLRPADMRHLPWGNGQRYGAWDITTDSDGSPDF